MILTQTVSTENRASRTLCGDRASSNAMGYLTEAGVCVHHFCRHCLGASVSLVTYSGTQGTAYLRVLQTLEECRDPHQTHVVIPHHGVCILVSRIVWHLEGVLID